MAAAVAAVGQTANWAAVEGELDDSATFVRAGSAAGAGLCLGCCFVNFARAPLARFHTDWANVPRAPSRREMR